MGTAFGFVDVVVVDAERRDDVSFGDRGSGPSVRK